MKDDRVLPVTRLVSALILPFLVAGFILLYLLPDRTEQTFAWTIRPTMTPMLMGAGYIAGAYFFLRAILTRQWHTVGNGLIAVTAFATPMGIATLLHVDRFNLGHLSFWIWAALYAITPFLVPWLYFNNRSADPRSLEPSDVAVPRVLRWLMAAAGGIQLLIGVAMFLAPAPFISSWPWALTPLTARVIAGWFALPGVGALVVALDPRWSAAKVTLEGALIWAALLLMAVARAWNEFDPANPLSYAYPLLLAGSLIGVTVLYLYMEGLRRKAAAPRPLAA